MGDCQISGQPTTKREFFRESPQTATGGTQGRVVNGGGKRAHPVQVMTKYSRKV